MSLRARLILVLGYVTVLAIVALAAPLGLSLRDRVDAEVRSQARGQADLLAVASATLVEPADAGRLVPLVRAAAATVHGRVIIVDAVGRLIADSSGSPRGVIFAARPEIASALHRGVPQNVRHSTSLGVDLLATARPVIHDGRLVGAVRITQSLADVGAAKSRTTRQLLAVGAVVLFLGLLAGSLLATVTARPLRRLERTARLVAGGDFEARALAEGSTEQRSLAGSFNDMTARLGGLLRAQRRFIADASHQLRTPLTGLRLRLEAASAPGRDEAGRVNDLEEATREVDRLAELVDGLLVLSRADEHQATATRCDLVAAAEDAVARFASAAELAGVGVGVITDCASNGWCDREDLAHALDALIENALAYGSDGGTVDVVVSPGQIEVRDRGPGLVPQELDVVFERFHRGSTSVDKPGTGLGLPIVRALAESWGGEVRLRNREDGGAVAVLTIPGEAPHDHEQSMFEGAV